MITSTFVIVICLIVSTAAYTQQSQHMYYVDSLLICFTIDYKCLPNCFYFLKRPRQITVVAPLLSHPTLQSPHPLVTPPLSHPTPQSPHSSLTHPSITHPSVTPHLTHPTPQSPHSSLTHPSITPSLSHPTPH